MDQTDGSTQDLSMLAVDSSTCPPICLATSLRTPCSHWCGPFPSGLCRSGQGSLRSLVQPPSPKRHRRVQGWPQCPAGSLQASISQLGVENILFWWGPSTQVETTQRGSRKALWDPGETQTLPLEKKKGQRINESKRLQLWQPKNGL